MLLNRRKHILRVLASAGVLLALLLPARLASAQAYGDGSYGQCPYGQSCASSTSNPSASSSSSGSGSVTNTTDTAAGSTILLNDFDQYFQPAGKTLDVGTAQVIYFNVDIPNTTTGGVTTEKHSVTIQEVGDNYVVLVIASTPQTVRLNVGETGQYDVTGDTQKDIAITLNSITNKKANLTFKQLGITTKKTTTTVAAVTPAPAKKSWWPVIIYGLMTLVGVGLLIWLIARKKRSKS